MKILHVAPTLNTHGGGTSTAIVGMARAQQSAGLDVRLFITPEARDDMRFADELRSEGIPIEQVEGHGRLYRNPAMNPMVDRAVADADVVHIHAMWEQVQHIAARAAQDRNVPYVITPHGMLDPWSYGTRSRWKKELLMFWRARSNLNQAAAIHYATSIERDVSVRLKLRAPTIVEPFGLNLDEYENHPAASTFRDRFPQLADRPYVVMLGRLAPQKGLDYLIPAFAKIAKQVPQAMLVLAGPNWENLQARWEALATQHGIGDRMLFTGMLYGGERLAALAGAHCFALPSHHENFGIVVIEALACGVPVIVSDQVYLHPYVTEGDVGQVVPLDVEALAQALLRWLTDSELRAAAAGRAKAFARQQFDPAQVGKHWATHYQRLIAR